MLSIWLKGLNCGKGLSFSSDHLPVVYISDCKMNSVDVSKSVVKSQRLINDVSIERFNNALSDDLSDALSYVIFKNHYRRYLIDHL